MADVTGRVGKLAVSTDGVSYTDLGGVKDVSMPFSRDTIEVTDFDSAGWKESLSGIGNSTISATMNYDEADAGQTIVVNAISSAVNLYFRWRPMGDNTGDREFIFQTSGLTSAEDTASVDGVNELSIEAEMTGAPTIQAQP